MVCGSLTSPHCGHTERGAVLQTSLEERREWVFILPVLRLGTAIVCYLSSKRVIATRRISSNTRKRNITRFIARVKRKLHGGLGTDGTAIPVPFPFASPSSSAFEQRHALEMLGMGKHVNAHETRHPIGRREPFDITHLRDGIAAGCRRFAGEWPPASYPGTPRRPRREEGRG